MSVDFYPHCCFGILLSETVPDFVKQMTPESLIPPQSDTDDLPGPWDENWERDMLEKHGEALLHALHAKGISLPLSQLEHFGGSLGLIWTGEEDERADRKHEVPAETWILGLGLLKNPTHYFGTVADPDFWRAGKWHLWTTYG